MKFGGLLNTYLFNHGCVFLLLTNFLLQTCNSVTVDFETF